MKNMVTSEIEIEKQVFMLENGVDGLSEFPGRIGLFIASGYSSQKIYFDNVASLRQLQNMFKTFADILEVAGEEA